MAPPIPGLRRPVQVQRRSAGDVLLGILAVLALTALTIGVPIALLSVFGIPIPHHFSTNFLTHQLDAMSIMRVLAVVVWLLWIQLVWCVVVEIRAAVRNVGVPGRVPLAGTTQSAAHRLVSAALLLFSATAALTPAFTHSGPPRPAHSVTAQARPGGGGQQFNASAAPQQAAPPSLARTPVHSTPTAEKIYVVKPPEGRYHESLWEIAENHLGDGRRYGEIYELNKDHVQPDGSRLTIASLIRPGWVLRMPSDAHGPGIETISEHAAHNRHTSEGQASESQSSGGQSSEGQDGYTSTGTSAPTEVGTPVAANGSGGGASGFNAATDSQQATPVWPYELSSASLLAAGVLVALGRRRREQLWRRVFGMRLAAPEADAATAEQALRMGADDPAVQVLDAGLRHLAQTLAAAGRIPPTVYAAHLGKENLDLWVAPPDPNPPFPWTSADEGQVWRLPVTKAAVLDTSGAPAPYPGLVSIGTDETGRVMADLEVANGLISVRGPEPVVQAALAALAVELVTNRWSDRMQVTLIGFGDELTLLAPERVRAVPSVDDVLPELERRAAEMEQALAVSGFDSVLTGRSAGNADTWAPHYLIMGVAPTQEQADRLLTLARSRHRMAAGYVVAGDVRGATWTWDITDDGRLRAGVLGFDLKAQLLPPGQYQAIVELFKDAAAGPGVPLTNPAVGAAPVPLLRPDARAAAEVGILGPAVVSAMGTLEPERLALATELVAYLAAHPEGAHPNVLTGAIWPRGVSAEVRDSALARVTAWLGSDDRGAPNLLTDNAGRVRLGPAVRVDWQVFRGLISQAAAANAAGEVPGAGQAEAGYLTAALNLVRGPLLDGHEPGRYAWLATDEIRYESTALVADAAHRLSALRYSAGDPGGAMEAARAGLRLSFDDEQLWRDLLLGAHATGSQDLLRSVVGELCARTALDEVMPRMAPETEALIDEIFPAWRTTAA
jgi:hypothetical protein